MAIQWDETLSKLAKKHADKYNIPTDQAKEVIECYVSCNAKKMREGEVVLWVNIGRFYICPVRTLKWLLNKFGKRTQESYKRTRTDEYDREWTREQITKHYHLLEKARKQSPRTGKWYRYMRLLEKIAAEHGITEFEARRKLRDVKISRYSGDTRNV
jgi:hypothetical protein